MILTVDFETDTALYLQIRNQIVQAIAVGDLVPGDPLPSVRQLGEDLGINMHTVNKSYNLLKQEGFISVHRRKGVVIRTFEELSADDGFESRLRESLTPLLAEAICRGFDAARIESICRELHSSLRKGE